MTQFIVLREEFSNDELVPTDDVIMFVDTMEEIEEARAEIRRRNIPESRVFTALSREDEDTEDCVYTGLILVGNVI
jgi:hypothetical protein